MLCVICFEDCDFLFRRRDKEIYSKCAHAEMEKERVQRDKNGNMNNVAFYAVNSFRHMDTYVQNSKHKSQNTEVTSFEHRTQNICVQNTMSHIGFRSYVTALYRPVSVDTQDGYNYLIKYLSWYHGSMLFVIFIDRPH